MTTAHRPTFNPAQGREAPKGAAYHQRLLPAHTHLKTRQRGQGGIGGLASASDSNPSNNSTYSSAPRDLRAELLKAEEAVRARKNGGRSSKSKLLEGDETSAAGGERKRKGEDRDADGKADDGAEDPEAKRRRVILEEAHDEDAESESDDGDGSNKSTSDSDDDDDSDDSDDEEAELMRELAKIKAERAEQRAKEDAAKAEKDTAEREERIAAGNPLLDPRGGGAREFAVRRRWDDDVVFKNQARGTEEKGKAREFVNDMLRSDFHKRFMAKYVR